MRRGLKVFAYVLMVAVSGANCGSLHGQSPAPSAQECEQPARDVASGGPGSFRALVSGRILGCPSTAPAVLASAIRASADVRDTTYLDQLAPIAARVRDSQVFGAALALAADRHAGDPGRVLGVLVLLAQLGGSQYVEGYSRAELFVRPLPGTGVCGFEIGGSHRSVDNPLPSDAERQAARALDGILYAHGESVLLHNLARCARTMVSFRIPPQVDTRQIRIDHVCGNTFRVQNHTPVDLLLEYVVLAPDGTTGDEVTFKAPAAGGWTEFTVDGAGTLRVSYDGNVIATVANGGKRCGGASST